MAVLVGSARIDENGKATNGKAGDQTGKEVGTQDWYLHKNGWVVLRAKDPVVREMIARCMQAACDNNNIGYDQSQRETLYNIAKKYNFDCSKVDVPVETDCSALVRVCLAYSGIIVGNFNTSSEVSVLKSSGKFDVITDSKYCASSDYLLRGDVLVTAVKAHTVVVLSNGSKALSSNADTPSVQVAPKKSTEEIAKEVLNGKWGTGEDIKNRLSAAGYSYSEVQSLVNSMVKAQQSTPTQNTVPTQTTPVQGNSNEEKIWNYLFSKIGNAFGVAGLMGNIKAESGCNPKNLQNSYEKKLGMTDEQYTNAVDSGTYTNFVKDAAGYGLVQWTYWSLKQGLLEYVRAKGKSIGDLDIQLEFLVYQLSSQYKPIWEVLKTATSVQQASNEVLLKFERPADQSVAVQNKRASFGQEFYNKYAGKSTSVVSNPSPIESSKPTQTVTTKFSPRLTAPSAGDKHYINYQKGGYCCAIILDANTGCVMPNCVGYAAGRFAEEQGINQVDWNIPVCNAEDFIERASKNGYTVGKQPKLGAIIVWSKGNKQTSSDGCGHVAVVEKIDADGTLTISESGYKSFMFRTSTVKPPYAKSGYNFEGFVYPKVDFGTGDLGKQIQNTTQPSSDNTSNTDKQAIITLKNPSAKPSYADYKDTSISGQYVVTASALNMRTNAKTDATIIGVLPKGAKVNCYGFYNKGKDGTRWYYVAVGGYTGFCSSEFLKKC